MTEPTSMKLIAVNLLLEVNNVVADNLCHLKGKIKGDTLKDVLKDYPLNVSSDDMQVVVVTDQL